MKPILHIFFLLLSILKTNAQEINWRALNNQSNHLISAHFGADYSSYYGVSYAYGIKNKYKPVFIGTEFTLPFGKQVTDDWRGNLNIQTELWHNEHLSLGTKLSFFTRRYASPMATIYNTSTALSIHFGYLRPKVGAVLVVAYDQTLVAHVSHKLMKEYYPQIRDGWYDASGGTFKFGIRGNWSHKSWSTTLTLGKAFARNFKDNPTLPFFAELSVQKRFGR
ncbi:hypothetical protein [Fluviicola taffensis]|uniref:Outer membrane protein beta-barrel domain-containing protein n=1 Tax=Fluviicola taffensis (strain DSM 16823 / NCIMB 13979 / RW262) TaxID=755732 RepID=F2IAT8_FLUTR|nr:hypothetical protein [Fluviicola taffensis]AEA44243.1 hypothetical protein Fluta_2257 [Fluviicola taffensis DSM 16823]